MPCSSTVHPGPRRIAALLPHGLVAGVWAALYATFGFGSSGSGYYVHPLRDPLHFLGVFWERAPVLLLGQWTIVPADLAAISDPTKNTASGLQLAGLAVTAVLVLLMGPLLLRDRVARFWCAGSLLSLVPISAVGPQNRLLFFVGLGSMGLLAMFVHDLVSGPGRERSRFWRWPAWGLAGVLLLTHLVLAPPLGLLFIQSQSQAEQRLARALSTLPDDPAIASQDLILVNPPDATYTVGVIPFVKRVAAAPAPRRMRALSVGSSPIEVTRVDSHTLDLRLEYGLFSTPISRYFRSAQRGFEVGEHPVAEAGARARDAPLPLRRPARRPVVALGALEPGPGLRALVAAPDRRVGRARAGQGDLRPVARRVQSGFGTRNRGR
jgi:hypothetical protein